MSVIPIFAPGRICTSDPASIEIDITIFTVEEVIREFAFGPFAGCALAAKLLHEMADNVWTVAQVKVGVQLFAQISFSFDELLSLISA